MKEFIKRIWRYVYLTGAFMIIPVIALAAEENATINTGDTAFVLISAALVMLMTPGLAFFYGGMVRRKNVLNMIMQSFIIIAIISIQWVLAGYSLVFGPDHAHIIGDLSWFGLNGVGLEPNPDYAATIPHQAFMIYQLMFAIITPALITGAFAERMRFPAFIGFTVLWSFLVYDPLAHWVWGAGGWLRNLGALDFAGGNVVHISSGVSGLVLALILGKRKKYDSAPLLPHSMPMIILGAGILWFGWFGFNAGSALGANSIAVNAFVTTNTSAAAAVLSWVAVEWMRNGKPTILGAVSGAVAGLVSITPGAGFVDAGSAIIIGLVGGVVCYFAISVVKAKLGYDDALDAFGIHGIGGMWGAVATGLFASKAVNPAGNNGLLFGNPAQLGIQLISVAATVMLAIAMTFIIVKLVAALTPLRASEDEEDIGMDISQHGEDAYPETMAAAYMRHVPKEEVLEIVPQLGLDQRA
ncbi:ammonium transporter [Mahella australiensis]|uniref:Ammonium transporter n=1 Tax=Mahella australiensis (strain DSM 15567 / CIP 107919 / 50-1 BON) TaxID=697281 RepID=F3ZVV4_MAHA5|nr:ammonium transporter [Mahella australiensis]AEE95328.1 ammonium transporter (TC 1.A.11) [Mahella australiensis 50-1 BON]